MNSDINKEKEREKKKKKKKFQRKKGEITKKAQEDLKKESILSKLDTLDDTMKEESRVVEEKLKSGLIKSEQAEKEEFIEREKLTVIEIKKEINNLQNIKNRYHAEGKYEKVIKTSKKIIVLAFSNNLKSIVNEENKFLNIIRKKVIQEPEELDIPKEDESMGAPEVDLVGKDIINEESFLELKETEIQEKNQIEEEKRNLKIAKQELEQEKLKFEEERKAFNWEKQMMEDLKKFERDKAEEGIEKNYKLKFDEEKDRFEQEKLEFEEKEEKFKQERIRFEEEKEAFKWEKQMFEEVKKHEKERGNDLKET